jgi:hypothetical protein
MKALRLVWIDWVKEFVTASKERNGSATEI